MRHRVVTKTLNRDTEHRKALLKNLSTSLVLHEKIVTTIAKAKYLRPHFEKLITKARKGPNFNNVKYLKTMLTTDDAVKKILNDVAPRFLQVNGGYTRIIKMSERIGDNAPLARIELTLVKKKEKKEETKADQKKI